MQTSVILVLVLSRRSGEDEKCMRLHPMYSLSRLYIGLRRLHYDVPCIPSLRRSYYTLEKKQELRLSYVLKIILFVWHYVFVVIIIGFIKFIIIHFV
jgi:hypothetical protein